MKIFRPFLSFLVALVFLVAVQPVFAAGCPPNCGNPTAGSMLELDAIAAAVIGGTLLTGGAGSMSGTVLGVLIFGVIQTAIVFDGRLSSWWSRIAVGVLLLAFLLAQRLLRRAPGCSTWTRWWLHVAGDPDD